MTEQQFLSEDNTVIRLVIDNQIYIVEKNTTTDHLYNRAIQGEFGEILPYDPEVHVAVNREKNPIIISRMQAKYALLEFGLLDQVELLIQNMDRYTQLAWSEASEFNRNSPLLNSLKKYITWPDGSPLTDEDIDDLFNKAKNIVV